MVNLYPVYYVNSIDSIEYLLNIHQTLAGCCEIDNLFEENNEGRLKEAEPLKRKEKASEKSTCLAKSKGSVWQPSIVSKFPTMPDMATLSP